MSTVNSFAASFADVIAAIEERVRNGVEQPDRFTVPFQAQLTNYEIPRLAFAITRVTGLRSGAFVLFQQGVDFTLTANRLVWLNDANRPDEGSRLTVEFTYREAPSGLTDFNPGSVVGTLVRAVARELTLLYDQMDEAYRRAFIDEASGVALDNVVALLGIVRNPAQKATGVVTFARKKAPTQSVVIPAGTRVADSSGRAFQTSAEVRLSAEPIEEFLRASGVTIETTNQIASVEGVWLRSQNPETDPSLAFAAGFGDAERTVALTSPPASTDVRIRYIPKSVNAEVVAVEPGPNGTVNAKTLTIMPTPPAGIDSVSNNNPTDGGQEAEPDDRLRERAKHALERAGNATLNALRFALLDVDGLEDVDVVDHSTDEAIPLGEVRVRYSGGDRNEVLAVVERTRAAGVIVRVDEVVTVLIAGAFVLIPAGAPSPAAGAAYLAAAIEAISALGIGEPLSVRKVAALVFGIAGVADVAEAQLRSRRPDPANPSTMIEADVTDPLLIDTTELIRPDSAGLRVTTLTAIQATADVLAGAPPGTTIDIQLTDQADAPVTFRSFSLDLQVTMRATLTARPDAPPERIGAFTRALQFTASATATLTVSAADLSGLRPEHDPTIEFQISAAAYPGLRPASRIAAVRP